LSKKAVRNKDTKMVPKSPGSRLTARSKAALTKKVTITDAELQNLVGKAWTTVEKKKKSQLNRTIQPKKVPLRSQASIDEEKLVNNIVSKAWKDVDTTKKEPVKKKTVKKPGQFNKSFRTQESINQEMLFSQINMSEVWKKAEEMKIETAKMRNKAQKKKEKPKLHSQQSIMEEITVQKIVNKAWKDVKHDDKNTLGHIKENEMNEESSFEDSDMEDELPKQLSPSLKPTERKIKQRGPSPQVPLSNRRTRASRKAIDKNQKSSSNTMVVKQENVLSQYLEPNSRIGSLKKDKAKVNEFSPSQESGLGSMMTTPVKENMAPLVEPSPEVY